MNFFSKTIIFIIEAIVVVAVVLWFVYFNPFGWFKGSKLVLNQTVLDVKDIKSIGQLITAEYYGETISSYQNARLESYKPEEFNEMASQLFDSLVSAMYDTDTFVHKLNRKIVIRPFHLFYKTYKERYSGLTNNYLYYPMVIFSCRYYKSKISDKLYAKLPNDINNFKKLNKYEEPLIEAFYNKIKDDNDIDNIDFGAYYSDTYATFVKNNPIKAEKQKEAIMLGRGWVKAGVNFNNITNQNFRFISDKKIVHFYKMKPEILACDINPWLVPGKIYGFEFVKLNGKITDPNDIVEIKRRCIETLRKQATESHIIEQAQVNAEKNLKAFFSLLTGTEISQVKFINKKYEVYSDVFSSDTLTYPELCAFDSIWRTDINHIDKFWYDSLSTQRTELKIFIDSLKNQYVKVGKGCILPLSMNTIYAAKIIAGATLSASESNEIKQTVEAKQLRNLSDSIWYKSPAELSTQTFNVFLKAYQHASAVHDTMNLNKIKALKIFN